MGSEIEEKNALNNLEDAAEAAAVPEEIEHRAKREKDAGAAPAPRFWFVPYLIGAMAAGGFLLFLQWRPRLFNPSLDAKVHRYLFGVLGIIAVLVITRA